MHYPIYAEFINFQPPGMKQPHKKHKTTRCSLKTDRIRGIEVWHKNCI